MADLGVELLGHRLVNPLIVSSGPLTHSAQAIRAAFRAGAAGAVTKTISRVPAVNPTPHLARARAAGSLLNAEGWADLSAERWMQEELPALRGEGRLVIASIGHTEAEVRALARPLVRAGADMLELVSYRGEDMAPMVRAARRSVDVPILAKVSANWPDLVQVAGACVEAGAGAITAIDSLGPALQIDVETARPVLGSAHGLGWLSGAAIRPIAVRAVADLARGCRVPVVGVGGIASAEDVVEMLMVGAVAVGLHTALLLGGLATLGKLSTALSRWLDGHGYARAADVRGLALPHLKEAEEMRPLDLAFDSEACTGCERCISACAYGARSLSEGQMTFERGRCRSCGLCASVCPAGALRVQGWL